MREIKFRAWDKESELMIYQNDDYYAFCIGETSINVASEDTGDWIKCEIMQYTGLHDKKGKEIYEGDICNCREYECYGKIEWSNDEAGFFFCILCEGRAYEEERLCEYVDELEVIGNIHENPELLQEESHE